MRSLILVLLAAVFLCLLTLTLIYESHSLDDFDFMQRNFATGPNELLLDPACNESSEITYYYYNVENVPFEKNNKFGLYIYSESKDFFNLAEKLVNSNGGDWGYVLLPYNVKDRDYDKWGRVFSWLLDKHLIPVIQLHDIDVAKYEEQTQNSAKFLNSFVWPTKQRYISVYNEPNDANFWYGYVNAAEYAEILDFTIDTYNEENADFFMLNGAFNASASTTPTSLDSFEYMRRMNEAVPGIFSKLDGWASHSYPQPNFSGSPNASGRWSIRAYAAELSYLESEFKVEKALPVFITETGWAHAEGERYNSSYLGIDQVSSNFKKAFEDVWLPDDRVVAVMPFTIKFDAPYDHFSWVNKDNVPYKHYEVVKSLKKQAGKPQMLVQAKIEGNSCPE